MLMPPVPVMLRVKVVVPLFPNDKDGTVVNGNPTCVSLIGRHGIGGIAVDDDIVGSIPE